MFSAKLFFYLSFSGTQFLQTFFLFVLFFIQIVFIYSFIFPIFIILPFYLYSLCSFSFSLILIPNEDIYIPPFIALKYLDCLLTVFLSFFSIFYKEAFFLILLLLLKCFFICTLFILLALALF